MIDPDGGRWRIAGDTTGNATIPYGWTMTDPTVTTTNVTVTSTPGTTYTYTIDYDDILRNAQVTADFSNTIRSYIDHAVYVYSIPDDLTKELKAAGISTGDANDAFIKFVRCMIEKKDEKDLAIAMKSSEQIFEFLDEYILRDEAD